MEYYDDCGKFHIGISLLFVEAKSWPLQFFSIIRMHTFGHRSNENMVEVEIIIFFILKE